MKTLFGQSNSLSRESFTCWCSLPGVIGEVLSFSLNWEAANSNPAPNPSMPEKLHLSFRRWINSGTQSALAQFLVGEMYTLHCLKDIIPAHSAGVDCEHINSTWPCYLESLLALSFCCWLDQTSVTSHPCSPVASHLPGLYKSSCCPCSDYVLLLMTCGGTSQTGCV